MSISVNIHPQAFQAQSDPSRTTVWIHIPAGDPGRGTNAAIFLNAQQCDELIEAATAAKELLAVGEGDAS